MWSLCTICPRFIATLQSNVDVGIAVDEYRRHAVQAGGSDAHEVVAAWAAGDPGQRDAVTDVTLGCAEAWNFGCRHQERWNSTSPPRTR